jgi:L-alanine-DL-glutamate epimerase-like enolase superfamily enzyme
MDRRQFIKNAGIAAALSGSGLTEITGAKANNTKTIRVIKTDSDFEREKLVRPFGFKGGFLTECWQIASKIQSQSGIDKIGIATQNVLYADANLFAVHSEAAGNALMYILVNEALQLVKTTSFTDPVNLFEKILPEVVAAGKKLTGPDLNINFVYNALVSVDNAAWLLYAAENKFSTVDAMIPDPYQPALSHHNNKIAIMYQVPYGMPMNDLKNAVQQGYFVIKIKTGYPGSQATMLEEDMARLTLIHNTLKDARTDHTTNGKLIYTMDANARYEKKETLFRYLDHAKKIGAFEQVLLYEEPFVEVNDEDVKDIGITIAGDESVHDEAGAMRRLSQGYTAIVLKGIAKTLSLSMRIAKLAYERKVPCLCADLTVNPILIDWHKNLAARLAPFPGIGMGLMETNGNMNYRNWSNMMNYNPAAGTSWTKVKNGIFELDKDFFDRSGGIFEPSSHYTAMFQPPVT